MKFALIDDKTGRVLQWQDTTLYGYADPLEGQTLRELADDFTFPDAPSWLVSDAFTDQEPASTEPALVFVPLEVSMRQARLALLAAGQLAAVGAAIAKLPSPQKDQAQIEWDYGTTVRRDSPIVALLGPALGDEAAIDALFTAAAQL